MLFVFDSNFTFNKFTFLDERFLTNEIFNLQSNLHFQWNFQSSIWSSVSMESSFSMKSSYNFQSIYLVNHAFLKFLWISLWGHLALEKLLNMREIFNSMVKIQIFDENRKESLVNWKWLILEDSKRSFTLLFYTLMHFVKNQFWKSVRRKKTFNLELLLILSHAIVSWHN